MLLTILLSGAALKKLGALATKARTSYDEVASGILELYLRDLPKGKAGRAPTLTKEQIDEGRALLALGWSTKDVAETYGKNPNTVRRLLTAKRHG